MTNQDTTLTNQDERKIAIREANEIHDSDEYFKARPQIDNGDRRIVFEAGYIRGWQAATQASEQRIQELEEKLYAELKRVSALNSLRESYEKELEYYRKQDYSLAKSRLDSIEQSLNSEREMNQTLTNENTELQAHVNKLREALESAWSYTHTNEKLMNSIIPLFYSTSTQSLAEHDNEVIDQCKKIVADDALAITFQSMGAYRSEIIRQIGALKKQFNGMTEDETRNTMSVKGLSVGGET